MTRRSKISIFLALLLFLAVMILFLTSCSTPERMLGKIVGQKPGLLAEYCANTYPCLPGQVTSDTVTNYDTLWGSPEVIIHSDTVRVNDTVRVVRTVQQPCPVITRTVTIRDTIQVADKAALDACLIERKSETKRANDLQIKSDGYRDQRNKLRWILAGIGLAFGLWLFLFIRRKVIKK